MHTHSEARQPAGSSQEQALTPFSVLTWATSQRLLCKSEDLIFCLANPPTAAAVRTNALKLFSSWNLFNEAKPSSRVPWLFALTTRKRELASVPSLCPVFRWMTSFQQPNCSEQKTTSFLSVLVGDHKCVSHYLACFTVRVPAGVHCFGDH